MSDYAALIAAWNSTIQPPAGVTGTGLSTSMTTAQKLAALDSWTITGVIPTTIMTSGAAIVNCIEWSEFNALTAAQQTNILQLCAIAGSADVLLAGSTNAALLTDGMVVAYFSSTTITRANMIALAQASVTPWWRASTANGGGGLSSPVSGSDLVAAGGLT